MKKHYEAPKVGERYESTKWVTGDHKPLIHLITKIAQGTVYYRADYGVHDDGSPWRGASSHFPLAHAQEWLGKKIE